MKVAITVDELLLFLGAPLPQGYTSTTIATGMLGALADHEVQGAYAFPHTAPAVEDPRLYEVFEQWVDAGHHVGNHTHHHACLNWLTAEQYCADIRRAEDTIGSLIERAPSKYFRYTMDIPGRSEAKRGAVEDFLREQGYRNAPITSWFNDFAWIAPYARAIDSGDAEALAFLRTSYVNAAVDLFEEHAAAARKMFGADIPYIWLIHGTPPAQDLMGEILQRLVELGAEFISLDEAMQHPVHRMMPPVDGLSRNHLQRIGMPIGLEFGQLAPDVMGQVVTSALPVGEDPMAVYDEVIKGMCDRADGTLDWSWE